MRIRWTLCALVDMARLHGALVKPRPRGIGPDAADEALRAITQAVGRLATHPDAGTPLPFFTPRDIRHLVIGRYELRYEIQNAAIHILCLWHGAGNR